jgi:hypothetical protein
LGDCHGPRPTEAVLDQGTAYDAAANICPGAFAMIPVDLPDVMHEAVMAGYAAALSDLEEGKLDDQVQERSEIID